MTYAEALAALDALYTALPTLPCQGKCQQSCGVIIMTKPEWLRIIRKLGYAPKGKPSCVCPMLKQGRCSVHPIKPLICRLWGVTENMSCSWGCQPDYWLSDAEGQAFLERAEAIAQQVFPRTQPAAYAQGIAPDDIPSFVAGIRQAIHKRITP